LVTGGAGFIGSHIVDALIAKDLEVYVLDNLHSGKMENMAQHLGKEGFHFIKGDIRDQEMVKLAVREVDAVIHEAALVSVARSIEDPTLTNDVNVTGTLNLLKASSDAGVERLIYASSAAVYGKTEKLPNREDASTEPASPYAASKLAAEKHCRAFYLTHGLETISLRYFNVYGPRQVCDQYSGVITNFIRKLSKNEPPIIYGDGEQTRDFINVRDVVEATLLSLKRNSALGEEFNIAIGEPITINRLTEMLLKITGKKHLKPKHTDPRPGDIRHSYADISKAKKLLGYVPKIPLKEGLTNLVEWYKMHSPSCRKEAHFL
jgi:dTDP-glucose 4,6-dehydratase